LTVKIFIRQRPVEQQQRDDTKQELSWQAVRTASNLPFSNLLEGAARERPPPTKTRSNPAHCHKTSTDEFYELLPN
jgi:hypothetical protein